MLNINEDTTIVGSTELRNEINKLTKNLKQKKVIVTKRGTPIGVLEDYASYQEKEELLDLFEDLVLGHLAEERDRKSTRRDYMTSAEFKQKLDLIKRKI